MSPHEVVAFGIVALAGALALARVVRPGSTTDRAVGLEVVLVITVTGVATGAYVTGQGVFLDVLVATALLGFVGAVALARFVGNRGQ